MAKGKNLGAWVEWRAECPLRKWRKRGLFWVRQSVVAYKLDCTPDLVSRWELGKSIPGTVRFGDIALLMATDAATLRQVWVRWLNKKPG